MRLLKPEVKLERSIERFPFNTNTAEHSTVKNKITNYLLTESEVVTRKSQTEALSYRA